MPEKKQEPLGAEQMEAYLKEQGDFDNVYILHAEDGDIVTSMRNRIHFRFAFKPLPFFDLCVQREENHKLKESIYALNARKPYKFSYDEARGEAVLTGYFLPETSSSDLLHLALEAANWHCRVGGKDGSDLTESLLPGICRHGNCSGRIYRRRNRIFAERLEAWERKFPRGRTEGKKRAEGKGTEASLLEKETTRDGTGRKRGTVRNSGGLYRKQGSILIRILQGEQSACHNLTRMHFLQTIIQVYQKSSGLKEMLGCLTAGEPGSL